MTGDERTHGGEAALQRRYERLVRCYPRPYRAAHGAEIVGTLLEASAPGQRRPALREVTALAADGLRVRLRRTVTGPTPWWLDGIHLAVFLLALANLGTAVTAQPWYWSAAGLLPSTAPPPGRPARRTGWRCPARRSRSSSLPSPLSAAAGPWRQPRPGRRAPQGPHAGRDRR